MLPRHISNAILKGKISMSPLACSSNFGDNDLPERRFEKLLTHAVTQKNEFALASTYVESARLNLVILIGCSTSQITKLESRLRRSKDAIQHPLFALGMCSELHLELLKEEAEEAIRVCDTIMCLYKFSRQQGYRMVNSTDGNEQDLYDKICVNRLVIRKVVNDIKTTQAQLNKALKLSLEWVRSPRDFVFPEFRHLNNRFQRRLDEITLELEELIAKCHIRLEDSAFRIETVK